MEILIFSFLIINDLLTGTLLCKFEWGKSVNNETTGAESCLFELFSIKFIIDKNFNLVIFDINRKINLIDKNIIPIYSRLMVDTYNLVRGDVSLEETRFFKISE